MKLVQRLALTDFFRILGFTILSALVLFTLLDIFGHMDSFIDNEASAGLLLRYYLNKLPWIIDIVLPIAMLMATMFTIGTMARYNELTALFASGRSLMQVAAPLMTVAVIMTVFSFIWSEFVLPRTNAEIERIWEVELHGHPDRTLPTSDVPLYGTDGRLYYARAYNPQSETIKGFRAVKLSGSSFIQRHDAESAVWTDGMWRLENGSVRFFEDGGERDSLFTVLDSGLDGITPETFLDKRVKPEAMNARQLKRFAAAIRAGGGDPTEFLVDYQFKLSFPTIHIIVVFLGILLASGPRKTTVATGFGWTVLISFGYYLFMNFGRALGHNGVLPPVAAAWAGTIVYTVLSLLIFLRIRR